MKQAGSRCVGRYPGWRHACIAFPAACSRQPVASVMQVGHRDGPVGYTLSRRTPPSSIQPRPLDRCGGSAGTSAASCLPRLSCFPLNCHPLNMNGEHQRGDCSGPASGHAFVPGYRYRPLHKCDCNATPRRAGSRVSRPEGGSLRPMPRGRPATTARRAPRSGCVRRSWRGTAPGRPPAAGRTQPNPHRTVAGTHRDTAWRHPRTG